MPELGPRTYFVPAAPQPGTAGTGYLQQVNTQRGLMHSNSGSQGQRPKEMPEVTEGGMVRWKEPRVPVAVPLHLSEPVCTPGMQVIILCGVVVSKKMSAKLVARSRERLL